LKKLFVKEERASVKTVKASLYATGERDQWDGCPRKGDIFHGRAG